jgi:hypothetical protein
MGGDSCCGLSETVFLMWVLHYSVGGGGVAVQWQPFICRIIYSHVKDLSHMSVLFKLKLSKCEVSAFSLSI